MPLSEHEQKMLQQIESALYAEDPKFVQSVSQGKSNIYGVLSKSRVVAFLVLSIGLLLLVFGLRMTQIAHIPVFSILGFIIILVAGIIQLRRPKIKHMRKKSKFVQNMEEKFKRRYQGGF